MFTKKRIMVFLSVLALSVLLAVPALSEIKYFQGNLSRAAPGTSNTTMRVCDGVKDGHGAASEFRRYGNSNSGFIQDLNGGANGDCTNAPGRRDIERHLTCERVNKQSYMCNKNFSYH